VLIDANKISSRGTLSMTLRRRAVQENDLSIRDILVYLSGSPSSGVLERPENSEQVCIGRIR
jgi:hypothetical protein